MVLIGAGPGYFRSEQGGRGRCPRDSGPAPCTAETNANWMDSLLPDSRAGVRRGWGTRRRRRNLEQRRPMGEEIELRKAMRIRRTIYTSALEGAVRGMGRGRRLIEKEGERGALRQSSCDGWSAACNSLLQRGAGRGDGPRGVHCAGAPFFQALSASASRTASVAVWAPSYSLFLP